MADTPKTPATASPPNAGPSVVVMNDPPATGRPNVMTSIQPFTPFTPPKLPETPPGGKFGARDVEVVDGKRTETIRYLNAHKRPFSDDPAENMKDK